VVQNFGHIHIRCALRTKTTVYARGARRASAYSLLPKKIDLSEGCHCRIGELATCRNSRNESRARGRARAARRRHARGVRARRPRAPAGARETPVSRHARPHCMGGATGDLSIVARGYSAAVCTTRLSVRDDGCAAAAGAARGRSHTRQGRPALPVSAAGDRPVRLAAPGCREPLRQPGRAEATQLPREILVVCLLPCGCRHSSWVCALKEREYIQRLEEPKDIQKPAEGEDERRCGRSP